MIPTPAGYQVTVGFLRDTCTGTDSPRVAIVYAKLLNYNAFNVYRRELAPGTVSLTGDRAQGDDSKHWANSSQTTKPIFDKKIRTRQDAYYTNHGIRPCMCIKDLL